MKVQTSMTEGIHYIESLNCAYVVFPSIDSAEKVYEYLNGKIYIKGNTYSVQYSPDGKKASCNDYDKNKSTYTYFTNVTDFPTYTAAMETTVHEDWICEYVCYTTFIIIISLV